MLGLQAWLTEALRQSGRQPYLHTHQHSCPHTDYPFGWQAALCDGGPVYLQSITHFGIYESAGWLYIYKGFLLSVGLAATTQ